MAYFVTSIFIKQLRHLQNMEILLSEEKKTHLILTGKNGSGKTSLLNALKTKLSNIVNGQLGGGFDEDTEIEIFLNQEDNLVNSYQTGAFITAYYPADRKIKLNAPHGVENIKLKTTYSVGDWPVENLLKYMVHLKTQQAYAKTENDTEVEMLIIEWFSAFEKALRKLMDDTSIVLEYDYKNYNFRINQRGRNPFGFNELSDGYSSAIYILADLLLRMDRNWLLSGKHLNTSLEGIALIDGVEMQLHTELQRTILPFFTEMFPNLQFIVTTHSPFVVNSLQNAVVYDLNNR